MLSDDQIVVGCRKGKHHAFNALYNKYSAKMLGVCFRYTKSKEEAEDVLQEGFIKVFNKISSFKSRGSFEGWLRRIMVNTAINHYKAKKKYQTQDIDLNSKHLVDSYASDEETIEVDETLPKEELMKILQDLPEGYRFVFNMFVIEGMKHSEIAAELNISVNTSKSQLFKARRWLRQRIEERQKQKTGL